MLRWADDLPGTCGYGVWKILSVVEKVMVRRPALCYYIMVKEQNCRSYR